MNTVRPNTRAAVLARDGHRCVYCGKHNSRSRKLTMDHVVPRSAGGGGTVDNLVACCRACNSLRGDGLPLETREGYDRDLLEVYVRQLREQLQRLHRQAGQPGIAGRLRRANLLREAARRFAREHNVDLELPGPTPLL